MGGERGLCIMEDGEIKYSSNLNRTLTFRQDFKLLNMDHLLCKREEEWDKISD